MNALALYFVLMFFVGLLFLDLGKAYKVERSELDKITGEEILEVSYMRLRQLIRKKENVKTYVEDAVQALDDFIKYYKIYSKPELNKHVSLEHEVELEEKALQMKIMGGILLSRLRVELEKGSEGVPLAYKLLETDLNELRDMILV